MPVLHYGKSVFTKETQGIECFVVVALLFKFWSAVDQVVACAPVTQRAQVQSPVGTSFLGEVPEYHLAIILITHHSLRAQIT